jgi:glycosyltransferase involved in cell wall biosynthesis
MSGPLVALDARLTRQMSAGMKTYVRELVARLPVEAPDLRFVVFSNEALHTGGPNVRIETISEFTAVNGALGEQVVYPRHLRRGGADLIHYMSVYAPRRSTQAYVYTIHDLIHLRFPSYFSWKVPLYYRLVVGPVARGAQAVITDANATVADLGQLLGVTPNHVNVVPLGVSQRFSLDDAERSKRGVAARARFGIERPYFLYAGNHRPHKNLATLIRAWRDGIDTACDLVVTEAGPLDADAGGLEAARRSNAPDGKLHLPGHVALEELISLYAGCVAAVQPSLYEGFGLSVLEAMACGAPVIIAQTPALLEVGGDAVTSFPPTDAAALSRIMTRLLTDDVEGERLASAGRERVRAFTWSSTARATAAVYREALSS